MHRRWIYPLAILAALAATLWPEAAQAARVIFKERVLRAPVYRPTYLHAVDLDGDGDMDVLSSATPASTIIWHENRGPSAYPRFTDNIISSNALGAWSVFAADLDGDGDMDVLSASASDDKIAWYENDGAAEPSFQEWIISVSADEVLSVFATDLDGDSDVDVLSGSCLDDKVAWYENDGQADPSFEEHVITEDPDGPFNPMQGLVDCVWQVTAVDLDGDGDRDVVAAAENADRFFWFQNSGGSSPIFTPRQIHGTAGAKLGLSPADLDGDGDMDIVSASGDALVLAWFENDGAPLPTFSPHSISTRPWGILWASAADIDGDGDIDALSASDLDERVSWYENDGQSPPSFTEHRLKISARNPLYVGAADLDGDGDMDVLSAIGAKILWHQNLAILPHSKGGRP